MADLSTNVRYIKGIGEQRAKALGKPVVEAYLYWVRHGRADRLDLTK